MTQNDFGQNDNGRDGAGQDGETFDHIDDAVDDTIIENEELSLVEDDGPLPWLESDYDDEEEGVDTGRLVGLALLGALLLALILGTIYFFSNRGPDPELVADGSTIEAPEGPMKERPADAGGKEFAGTGQVAPAVGDGQTTEGRLADGSNGGNGGGGDGDGDRNGAGDTDGAKPSIDTATTANAGATNSGSANANADGGAASSSGGVGVQVGAYSTRESAVEGWNRLTRQTDALKGVKYRVQQGQADIGTVFRLQAVAGDKASGDRLCRALKADGIACQVK